MLKLRAFVHDDIQALVAFLNNTDVTRFLSDRIAQPYTKKDATWWVNEGSKIGLVYAIEIDGQLAGCISALPGEYEYCRSAEVGYWLGQEFWGRGYALQALEQLLGKVSERKDIVRLYATVFDGNKASSKVLLKNGFNQEATLKKAAFKNGKFYDTWIFAKLNTQEATTQ